MVTVLCRTDLGVLDRDNLPAVTGADDAAEARWVSASTYDELVACAAATGGRIFAAHRDMLADVLG
ncbi:hypothetical protein [Fodinicola feengrottensis]|uniref:NUDIX hydrolase n=1 Tax=Fodinicola feengrottensis TaxID=435914 RepID=A0ABN2FRL7_9ACTN|nr:hypothetical protein [Fodinicola feengrottensis]